MSDGDIVKFSFNDTALNDSQLDRMMRLNTPSKDIHAERRALLLDTIRAAAATVASHQTPRDPLDEPRQDYTHTSYITKKQACLDYVVATTDLMRKAPTSEVCHEVPNRSDHAPLLTHFVWAEPTDRTHGVPTLRDLHQDQHTLCAGWASRNGVLSRPTLIT